MRGNPITFSSPQAWLEHYAIPVPESGCWIFEKAIHTSGYGWVGIRGVPRFAHRASWTRFYGAIPTGLCVLHRCDVRSCINPKHLFLGTKADNTNDCISKGRHISTTRDQTIRLREIGKRTRFSSSTSTGASNARAKLSEQDVVRIREMHRFGLSPEDRKFTYRTFGISDVQYHNIVTRRLWKHLP